MSGGYPTREAAGGCSLPPKRSIKKRTTKRGLPCGSPCRGGNASLFFSQQKQGILWYLKIEGGMYIGFYSRPAGYMCRSNSSTVRDRRHYRRPGGYLRSYKVQQEGLLTGSLHFFRSSPFGVRGRPVRVQIKYKVGDQLTPADHPDATPIGGTPWLAGAMHFQKGEGT